MALHSRLVAATRLAAQPVAGAHLNTRPDRWPGIARIGVLVGLAALGWSLILLPVL